MDKKFQLTEDKQKYSRNFINQLQGVIDLKGAFEERRAAAANEIDRLQDELNILNAEFVSEIDPVKLKEIGLKRKSIYFDIEDNKLIMDLDVRDVLRQKYYELNSQPLSEEARLEYEKYRQLIEQEIAAIRNDSAERIQELTNNLNTHVYKRFMSISTAINQLIRK